VRNSGYLKVVVQPVLDDENGEYSSGVKQSARLSFAEDLREKSETSAQPSSEAAFQRSDPSPDDRVVEGQGSGTQETDVEHGTKTQPEDSAAADDKESLPDHLSLGKDFTFRITVLHAVSIPTEYSDVFCQFNFLNHHDEAFSTEPIRNASKATPLSFFHVQNITVNVTRPFIDYLRTQPLVFEVFGHFQQTLNREKSNPSLLQTRQPPKRMLPPLLPVSQPLRSTKFGTLPPSPTSQIQAKHDLLVWVEILELASSGEYLPVVVERSEDLPCRGEFLLRQGLQRRIRITLVNEISEQLCWGEVRELVVGRIRNVPECDDDENDVSVVSLGLFPGENLELPGDGRAFYRFEAAWDSSLHNSVLLNRVTPAGEHIYLTMSAYVQLDNCEQPSVVTKDLCVTILGRDARTGSRSLKVIHLHF
jgi:kinesin family member 1